MRDLVMRTRRTAVICSSINVVFSLASSQTITFV